MALADFIKIPWNKFEAALLVDAYLQFQDGSLTKAEAVSCLSKRLRKHLLDMGIPVSEAYRNEAGISLQMSSIEYLMTDGAAGISHTSNLFRDTVELYNDNREEFDRILSTARLKYPLVTEDDESNQHKSTPYKIYENPAPVLCEAVRPKYVSKKLRDILSAKFPRGYKLDSYMEVSRLKKFYYEEYGDELDMEGEDIDEDVKACGIEYAGRVYLPELLLTPALKETLLSSIKTYFDNGGTCIYYTVLFQQFKDKFLDSHILNENMLKEYLQYVNIGEWYFSQQFFSKEDNANVNIIQDVIEYVKAQGGVVSEDDVVIGLPYYPEQQVRDAFDERDTNLVSCGRNLRFHLDNFVMSQEEQSSIEKIIKKAISKYGFIAFSELLKDMSSIVPTVCENNIVFSEIGIRNALTIKLSGKFYFYNSVISDLNNPIKPEDAFLDLAKRPKYTINEVKSLADACGCLSNLYLEPMLRYSVRIDKDNFVSKDQVHFDIESTDDVLLRICEGDYIPLADITTLSTLPSCEYKWTPFLLECYVAFYSKVFRLIHSKYFGQATTAGAIVKRNSHIQDFNTLAANALVEAGVPIEKKSALQFLCDKSYIVQRRYEDIDEVLAIANKLTFKKK